MAVAADITPQGRFCIWRFSRYQHIFASSNELLRAILASSFTPTIHGYWIHTRPFLQAASSLQFWKIQRSIITALTEKWCLQIFVSHLESGCNVTPVILASSFTSTIHGYWIHTCSFLQAASFLQFWKIQCSIIAALTEKRCLQIFVAHLESGCDFTPVDAFLTGIRRCEWITTRHSLNSPTLAIVLPHTLPLS